MARYHTSVPTSDVSSATRPLADGTWARAVGWTAAQAVVVTLGACAGELERPRAPVAVVPPPVSAPADAASTDAFVPVDARVRPDAAMDGSTQADATAPGPGATSVFLRVRADPWADGLRAALDPAQAPVAADASPDPALAALGAGVVPVFDFDRPEGPGESALLRSLSLGRATTALYDPGARPASVATDTRRLASLLLDDPACARLADRPVVFVDAGADSGAAALFDALETLAALPRPPVIVLGASSNEAKALPPNLDAAARASVVGRYLRDAEGWAMTGSGDLPPAAEARARDDTRRLLAAVTPVWVSARPPRNTRLDAPGSPVEAPGADGGLLRSLVLARRLAWSGEAAGVFVDGLGGWRQDTQLDALATGIPGTSAPESLTGGHVYSTYADTRLTSLRETLLTGSDLNPRTLAAPPLAELHRSDSISVSRLEVVGERVEIELTDRTAGGRWEVLLEARPFRVPPDARLRYSRTDPAIRVEWALAGAPADTLSESLAALMAHTPPTGVIDLDVGPLAGQVVESVVLVYGGGTGRVAAALTLPRVEAGR